jgi:hypothetical protein
VGFESDASNLVAGDTNLNRDSFVCDLASGFIVRVNVSSLGAQALGGHSLGVPLSPTVSVGGRYAAFTSTANNLVPNDTGGVDVFVRDMYRGTTIRASVTSTGLEGNGSSYAPSISSDGRFLVFSSRAQNFVVPDLLDMDAYKKDLKTGSYVRINVSSSGYQGNVSGQYPLQTHISSDARFVSFVEGSSNLVPGDTNGTTDVFLRDTMLGSTEIISLGSLSMQGNAYSVNNGLTWNGRMAGFSSPSTNLVSQPVNPVENAYVRNRGSVFATSMFLGWGCGGVGDLPTLYATSPVVGSTLNISGDSVQPSTGGILCVSHVPQTSIMIGNGCSIFLDMASTATVVVLRADAQGNWQYNAPIPSAPNLGGYGLAFQAIFLNGTGILGFDLTSGVRVMLGN